VARYHESVCRLCRREGMKLFLKGERCFKEKCAVERRPYAPGEHGKRRVKMQPYGLQLREKQKVRRVYGVLEAQFRRYFAEAARQRGVTGENLLRLLEQRLDNVVYSLGFASSRSQARQLVRHGHVKVDGRKVNVPSFQVRVGMQVELKEKIRSNAQVADALDTAQGRGVPPWLELDAENFRGKVVAVPTREDIRLPIQEQLIVELYSR
jgi:small subunit ribosomal protein S4